MCLFALLFVHFFSSIDAQITKKKREDKRGTHSGNICLARAQEIKPSIAGKYHYKEEEKAALSTLE
jgi:hypothetical protein